MTELPSEGFPQDLLAGVSLEEGLPSSLENSPVFGSRYSESSRDEFWDALSSNYDYLMDDGLIATCREASSDLSVEDESEVAEEEWCFSRFVEQFKWLHDLLHNLQVAKEGDSWEKSQKIVAEHERIAYLCQLFNEQADKLCDRHPDMRDEVNRRLNLLNNKWKAVIQNSVPVKSPSRDATVFAEITSRMHNLRRWLRELESRMSPIPRLSSWSKDTISDKYQKQLVLQKDIEGKGKCFNVLLKLCERLKGNVRFGQGHLMTWDADRVRKVASNLEHRWHALWLKSLERQLILEEMMQNSKTGCEKLEKSFSEEPLKKHLKLSDSFEAIVRLENELKNTMNALKGEVASCDTNHSNGTTSPQKGEFTSKNDKAVMVGDTGIAELKASNSSKFEIVVQDIGYSSETSAYLSTDDKPESVDLAIKTCQSNKQDDDFHEGTILNGKGLPSEYTVAECTPAVKSVSLSDNCCLQTSKPISNCNGDLLTNGVSGGEGSRSQMVYLAPDKYPSVNLKALNLLQEERFLQTSKSSGTCKNVPDTFYRVACVDEDIEEDVVVAEHVTTPRNHRVLMEKGRTKNPLKSIERDVHPTTLKTNIDREITSTQKKPRRKSSLSDTARSVRPSDLWKKSVCEWLDKCHSVDDRPSDDDFEENKEIVSRVDWSLKVVNSSCDASGECTTAESDSEKSTSDVNNSVTFSQSFTGSIETVVPAVQDAPVADPSPGVRLRKKRRSTRDRPWSVIELNRATFSVVPHSTSESALDKICSSQDSKSMLKKLCPKNKRFSLTDISNLNYLRQRHKVEAKFFDQSVVKTASDVSSDNCRMLLCTPTAKDSTDSSIKSEKMAEVQILLSETSSLPETTLSVDTSVPAAEDQASLSDQAWDEYQDPPYLSEPYSEQTVDEDEVRRLISFGDDYRATLGSYSDGSSVSLRPPKQQHRRTKSSFTKSNGGDSFHAVSSDTNSDTEDFHYILKTSSRTLEFVKNSLEEESSSRYAELVATCQTNLCLLKEIAAARSELESVSKDDVLKLQDLIGEWESLQMRVLALSKSLQSKTSLNKVEVGTVDVRSSLDTLQERLESMEEQARGALDTAVSLEKIDANISELQVGLSQLQEMKEQVLSVSAKILRLISEGGGLPSLPPLRESATQLYQQWEDVYELNCTQLTKLQTLKSGWSKSTEEDIMEDLETTVQWQPVQVGNNLPIAEVSREELHLNTAAEVQSSDRHDLLLELQEDVSGKGPQRAHVGQEKTTFNAHTKSVTIKKDCHSASKFWRFLRVSFPIQLILLILYCLSCHTEPQCCENMNHYDFSMLPKLRYLNGPPPV